MLELNEAQLDAILESYAKDNPKKLKFERAESRRPREQTQQLSIDWSEKLTGAAREHFVSRVSFKLPDQFRTIRNVPGGSPNIHKMPRRKQ